jgi:flagellar basal body L-ring protein FlgH
MKTIATLLTLILLVSCSSWQPKPPPVVRKAAPPPPDITDLVSPPKPRQQELGSIWSENSTWNSFYSVTTAREVGDIIVLKLDAKYKNLIQKDLEAISPTIVPKTQATTTTTTTTADAPPVDLQKDTPTPDISVRAFIQSVLPKGVYKITAAESIRIGNRDPYVVLTANVRDADITSNGQTTSEKLINPRVEVFSESEKPTNQN